MGWIIEKLFKLIMLLIILGVMGAVACVYLVNPNTFKSQITQIVQKYTGIPFQIHGDIQWTIKPQMVIHLNDVTLSKAPDDKNPALQIKEAIITLDAFSIFKSFVTINDLTLNNVVADWDLSKALNSTTAGYPLIVQAFNLKNGSMTLKDENDHLNWLLQNITLTATNLMLNNGQDMPAVEMQAELLNVANNAKYELDTTLKLDVSKHAITLDPLKMTWLGTPLQGTANIAQFSSDPVISGNMALNQTDVGALLKKMDPYFASSGMQIAHTLQMQTGYSYTPKDQILDLTKLKLQIDKGMLSGDVKLGFAVPYHAEFSLSADNLDLAPLGLLSSALVPSVHTMTSIPVAFLKNVVVTGKFFGTQLSINQDVTIDQVQMELNGQGGVVQFMPVIINAYGGTHNAALSIDVSKQQPTIQLTEQADKVDLEPWLKLVHQTGIMGGTASLKATLHASGDNLTSLQQSASGGINLYVNNGVLYGIDANRLLQFANQTTADVFNDLSTSPAANLNVLAIKRSSDWINTQLDKPKTKFDHLEFIAEIDQGASKKASLNFTTNVLDLKGTGDFSVIDQNINFDSSMMSKVDINNDVKTLATYLKQTPLTMGIVGTISKPVFKPDVQTYMMTVLKSTQADLLNIAISKMVAATPPNVKTDKTASDLFLASLQSLSK